MRKSTITIGFKNPAFKPVSYDISAMPANVVDFATDYGFDTIIRRAAASAKADSERREMMDAKYASLMAGETGGRAPMTPEMSKMRIGLDLAVAALLKAGTDGSAKDLRAKYISMPDPVVAAVTDLGIARGIDDTAVTSLIRKVKKTADAAYAAQTREI